MNGSFFTQLYVDLPPAKFSHQAHGDIKPAAHTTRISGRFAVGGVGQTEAFKQVVRNLARMVNVPQLSNHDQIFRTIKYDDIYINEYDTPRELRRGINAYMTKYNTYRPHDSLGGDIPVNFYYSNTASGVA